MDQSKKREEFERGLQVFMEGLKALGDQPDSLEVTFECPLCGGTAYAARASYNGHRHVHCPTCDIRACE